MKQRFNVVPYWQHYSLKIYYIVLKKKKKIWQQSHARRYVIILDWRQFLHILKVKRTQEIYKNICRFTPNKSDKTEYCSSYKNDSLLFGRDPHVV